MYCAFFGVVREGDTYNTINALYYYIQQNIPCANTRTLHYFFRLWVGDLCSILKYVWSLVNAGVDRYDDPSQHVRRPAPTQWFDNK